MERIVERNYLFDFYGDLLTEHQRTIYGVAVTEDLSLSELAEEYGISRQGVHDLIKRCDAIMQGYEDKLHLVERFGNMKRIAKQIEDLSSEGKDDKELLIYKLVGELKELL